MFERLGAGAMARIVGEPASGPERVEDYEAIFSPIYSWIHAIAQSAVPPSAGARTAPRRRRGGRSVGAAATVPSAATGFGAAAGVR